MAGMLGHDELDRRLGFHPGTPETAPLYEANRAAVLGVAKAWDDQLPPSREAALAQTALQEALMWANAAVATNLAPLGPERGAAHPAARGVLVEGSTKPCTCNAWQVAGVEHSPSCPAAGGADRG